MTHDHDTNLALIKILAAWLGVTFGGLTLSSAALTATLIFTALQIIVLLRKMWRGQA